MTIAPPNLVAPIPMQWIGPIAISCVDFVEQIEVPLATYETPLWPSTNRGARVVTRSGGISAIIVHDFMTRSVAVQAKDAKTAAAAQAAILANQELLAKEVTKTSRYAKLVAIHPQQVGNLLYIRFALETGDASGHNMVTKAADYLLQIILEQHPELTYVSVSGNFCTDKKVSAVNSILGRGKHVVCDVLIPRKLCQRYLRSSPEEIAALNLKKNLVGSIVAGSLHSANAHFANMLLAFYLATGQDAANIIEASQGIVFAEVQNQDLYFSVTLPNVIVGTIGNGKDLPFVRANLERLGCADSRESGQNARRLAMIAGATVLCGELSLLGALTNQGELMDSHLSLERARAC